MLNRGGEDGEEGEYVESQRWAGGRVTARRRMEMMERRGEEKQGRGRAHQTQSEHNQGDAREG